MDAIFDFALRALKSHDGKDSVSVCPHTLALGYHMLAVGAKGETAKEIEGLVKGIDAKPTLKLVEQLSEQPPKDSTVAKALIKSVNVIFTRVATAPAPVARLNVRSVVAYSTVHVEHAKTARGKCAKCKTPIPKDDAKYCVRGVYRCLDCFLRKELTLTGTPDQMMGWVGIRQASQDALLAVLNPPAAPGAAAQIEDSFKKRVDELGGAIFLEIATDGDKTRSAKAANNALAAATNDAIVDAVEVRDFRPCATGTYVLLVNVVRFEAAWKKPFDAGLTEQRYFHGQLGDRHEQYLYDQYSPARYSITSEATVVELLYKDDAFRFVAIMPSTSLSTWLPTLTMDKLRDLIKSATLVSAELDLRIPRFSLKSHFVAATMAMKTSVGTNADFTEISKATRLALSGISQACTLEVTEEGSCVAPAAPAPPRLARPPNDPLIITLDVCFVFVVLRGDTIIHIGQFV